MMAPFTSEDYSYFNHYITQKEMDSYIDYHKSILKFTCVIFIGFVLYFLMFNTYN
jgi:hypothetical protein